MIDHPTILDALATFLMGELAPKVEADKALQFRVLIAANLATTLAAETRTRDARLLAEGTRLQHLLAATEAPRDEAELEALNRQLAARLRRGELLGEQTLAHLLQTARETLEATNPRFELGD